MNLLSMWLVAGEAVLLLSVAVVMIRIPALVRTIRGPRQRPALAYLGGALLLGVLLAGTIAVNLYRARYGATTDPAVFRSMVFWMPAIGIVTAAGVVLGSQKSPGGSAGAISYLGGAALAAGGLLGSSPVFAAPAAILAAVPVLSALRRRLTGVRYAGGLR
jgi:hypothetical protein